MRRNLHLGLSTLRLLALPFALGATSFVTTALVASPAAAQDKPTADKPTADKPTADKPTADKTAADLQHAVRARLRSRGQARQGGRREARGRLVRPRGVS
jgi:hypothetical protein